MVRCTVLISNNPTFFSLNRKGLVVLPVDGSAYDVTVTARDHVHKGWRLLNHPLYGNFRPYHQPFRTLMLAAPSEVGTKALPAVDPESLHLLEQAIGVYESCADRWALPQSVPQEMFKDCSFIDCELMRATLDATL